jgi:hypothetical protein
MDTTTTTNGDIINGDGNKDDNDKNSKKNTILDDAISFANDTEELLKSIKYAASENETSKPVLAETIERIDAYIRDIPSSEISAIDTDSNISKEDVLHKLEDIKKRLTDALSKGGRKRKSRKTRKSSRKTYRKGRGRKTYRRSRK